MAHYAIGDVQGCFDELSALLQKLDFNHGTDTLWLTGDIVNRGPKSLETLQFVMAHESSIQTVLGNHDLHLLAVSYGFGKIKRNDTIQSILLHDDRQKMLDWLAHRPLLIRNDTHTLVHAGLLPQWSVNKAAGLAEEVECELTGPRTRKYFANMYGDKPTSWSNKLEGYDRLRMITNVFTRMRALNAKNELNYDFKSGLADMPGKLRAWFEAPKRENLDTKIVFGHWSALGYQNRNNIIALDTGALWGGSLTAINLDTEEVTQVKSLNGFALDWKKA
ncbi:symmetrical bis(5'-nucleosyl)-tetraphosphatase [Neisseria weaveri]|uniref:bis(5'-nucleosyl)-tetraphosphatase (symmetrical) n=1 Tax=Neisseria weaveri TaxID=28091 RepID=A0A3S5C9U8_9NEIS|nr:symmetrical bis(5'-nucleosyl)-tetraphosphatase [Neisseria weaveri]EGV36300.1 bis5'-nucleosyl-tetraphosphatase [Neisseria weaveri ATCC 51223]SAY51327.1 diadenosine tetraphosphatase [Neisseria weaveri]VEJ50255.1 diadenosine tetraphosphatase [Neisseria weaveri]